MEELYSFPNRHGQCHSISFYDGSSQIQCFPILKIIAPKVVDFTAKEARIYQSWFIRLSGVEARLRR